MILSDQQIIDLCTGENAQSPMIQPLVDHQVKEEESKGRVISYGVSSYGYDIRLGYSFMMTIPEKEGYEPLDPKAASSYSWYPHRSDPNSKVIIPPGGFLLAESIESFNMPEDVLGIVLGKSTYARCGLIINCTPLEPRWMGILTLELHNASKHGIVLYPGEGIAQITFHRGELPITSYGARSGKYQNQAGVEPAKV